MNKTELIDAVVKSSSSNGQRELTSGQVKEALEGILKAIEDCLVGGDAVQLTGFGTFKVTDRKAREGRNPKTGETIQIAAKRSAKFTPGKQLDSRVNS